METKENLESGLIWAPYVLVEHNEESLKEYREFMDKYNEEHEFCPKCGSKKHSTTLMGYPLIRGEEDKFRDLNQCVCTDCGDVHTTHERINKINKQKLRV